MFIPDTCEVNIKVIENRPGFEPAKFKEAKCEYGTGFGLFGIRERLALPGGGFEIESAPGQGAVFTLTAPASYNQRSDPAGSLKVNNIPEAGEQEISGISRKIRLVIADDHAVVRQGLCSFLESEPDIEIIGQAGDGKQALEMAACLKPDMILMDINMPVMNGIEATRAISSELKGIKIIGLSMYDEADRAADMLKAGAVAYVTKSGELEDLLNAIRSAHRAD